MKIDSSEGYKVIITAKALRHIEREHVLSDAKSFFITNDWEESIYETVRRGQCFEFGPTIIYRLAFRKKIGFDLRANCFVKILHVVTKGHFLVSAYPKKDFQFY
jgi:hypothetical protein